MNKVYLDKNGKLFVNGHEIKGVSVCPSPLVRFALLQCQMRKVQQLPEVSSYLSVSSFCS